MENLLNKDIREIIPHRDPFIFIDKIISIEAGCVVASKYIKKNEEYFKGHFPGEPLMPGVLIVESMAQAGGIACASYFGEKAEDLPERPVVYYLSRISDIKFKCAVLPDDTLMIKAKVLHYFEPFFKMQVSCEVKGNIVAEGELILTKQKG